jgi:hypothetical protein
MPRSKPDALIAFSVDEGLYCPRKPKKAVAMLERKEAQSSNVDIFNGALPNG